MAPGTAPSPARLSSLPPEPLVSVTPKPDASEVFIVDACIVLDCAKPAALLLGLVEPI